MSKFSPFSSLTGFSLVSTETISGLVGVMLYSQVSIPILGQSSLQELCNLGQILNPGAIYALTIVHFRSEPLFDNVLPHQQLAEQVWAAKANLASLHIPVTVSELAYGYQVIFNGKAYTRRRPIDIHDAMDRNAEEPRMF